MIFSKVVSPSFWLGCQPPLLIQILVFLQKLEWRPTEYFRNIFLNTFVRIAVIHFQFTYCSSENLLMAQVNHFQTQSKRYYFQDLGDFWFYEVLIVLLSFHFWDLFFLLYNKLRPRPNLGISKFFSHLKFIFSFQTQQSLVGVQERPYLPS